VPTNSAWLNSPAHQANRLDTRFTATGVAAVCCLVGNVGGQQLTLAEGFWVYVQEFAGGPGALPRAGVVPARPAPVAGATRAGAGQFILGFVVLHGLNTIAIGQCVDNQAFAAKGNAQQTTVHGLLVWRQHPQAGTRNWTAFTNGYQTWLNGPTGLAKRLNTQRFRWEADPAGLPLAP